MSTSSESESDQKPSSFRADIIEQLKASSAKTGKPVTESTQKTYASLLFNLDKQMQGDKTVAWFSDNSKKIIEYILEHKSSPQTQKTILCALRVLTQSQDYFTAMMDVAREVKAQYAKHELTPKQAANRLSYEQICEVYTDLEKKLKVQPTADNYVNVLLLGLMGGVFGIDYEPKRNEWYMVKVKNFDKSATSTDNYVIKDKVFFNTYKTAKSLGQKTFTIPPALFKIMKKWLKINTSDYLLCNPNTGNPFTSSDISKRLKKIFGGLSIGCDALRSIFINHFNGPALARMEQTANAMGHDISTMYDYYYKKPANSPA